MLKGVKMTWSIFHPGAAAYLLETGILSQIGIWVKIQRPYAEKLKYGSGLGCKH